MPRTSSRATKGQSQPPFEPNAPGSGLDSKKCSSTKALPSTPETKAGTHGRETKSPACGLAKGLRLRYSDVVKGSCRLNGDDAKDTKDYECTGIAPAVDDAKDAKGGACTGSAPAAGDSSDDDISAVTRKRKHRKTGRKILATDDDEAADMAFLDNEIEQLAKKAAIEQKAELDKNSEAGPAPNLGVEAYDDDDVSAEAMDFRQSKCEASMITKMEAMAGGAVTLSAGGGDAAGEIDVGLVMANADVLGVMSRIANRLGGQGQAAFAYFAKKLESSKCADTSAVIQGEAVAHMLQMEAEKEAGGDFSGIMGGTAQSTLARAEDCAKAAQTRMLAGEVEQERKAACTAIAAETNSPRMNVLYTACKGLREHALGIYRTCVSDIEGSKSCECVRGALTKATKKLATGTARFMLTNDNEVDDWEMYRLLCAAGADGPGAAPPPSANTRANDQAGGAGLAGTAAAGGSTGSTQQKPGAAGSAATGPAASAAADGTTGAPRQKPGAGAGTTATGAAHSASRGEAQQMQAVEDDPYCNPDDENTWEAKEYNRDDPEHGNVIYYDVERKYKNDCRKRGGRFDWACLMWFGDAAEPDTIKLLDSKYKRKPCQPTKRWSAKEDRYALCFADRDNKAGRSASAAGTGGGGGGKVPAAAGGSCTRFCTSCGAAVSTAFCGKCGAPVN